MSVILNFLTWYYGLFGLLALFMLGVFVVVVGLLWFVQVFESWKEPK